MTKKKMPPGERAWSMIENKIKNSQLSTIEERLDKLETQLLGVMKVDREVGDFTGRLEDTEERLFHLEMVEARTLVEVPDDKKMQDDAHRFTDIEARIAWLEGWRRSLREACPDDDKVESMTDDRLDDDRMFCDLCGKEKDRSELVAHCLDCEEENAQIQPLDAPVCLICGTRTDPVTNVVRCPGCETDNALALHDASACETDLEALRRILGKETHVHLSDWRLIDCEPEMHTLVFGCEDGVGSYLSVGFDGDGKLHRADIIIAGGSTCDCKFCRPLKRKGEK